jgi:hypothetical protein
VRLCLPLPKAGDTSFVLMPGLTVAHFRFDVLEEDPGASAAGRRSGPPRGISSLTWLRPATRAEAGEIRVMAEDGSAYAASTLLGEAGSIASARGKGCAQGPRRGIGPHRPAAAALRWPKRRSRCRSKTPSTPSERPRAGARTRGIPTSPFFSTASPPP